MPRNQWHIKRRELLGSALTGGQGATLAGLPARGQAALLGALRFDKVLERA